MGDVPPRYPLFSTDGDRAHEMFGGLIADLMAWPRATFVLIHMLVTIALTGATYTG